MIRAFKVAQHVFHLQLPDASPLWAALEQYRPFATEPVTEPLFSLRLSDGFEDRPMTVISDEPAEPGETVVKLYEGEDFKQIEMAPDSRLSTTGIARTTPDYRDAALHILSRRLSDAVFCINNTLMLLYAFTTASKFTLEMHASVIRCDGKGYLFLAKSGTGKSTHSQQWLKAIAGSELLNDDNPVVRVWPDSGEVIVYGSPWSGKTPCYRNIECPVGAFVQIRRSPENQAVKLDIFEAYALLWSSCSGLKNGQMADDLHETLEGAVMNAPAFNLFCRPDTEAARVCHQAVTPA